jgi:uncharacterized protein YuzE
VWGHTKKYGVPHAYNIAYIRFQEKRTDVETGRISDELVVDMAPDGTIYGSVATLLADASTQAACFQTPFYDEQYLVVANFLSY